LICELTSTFNPESFVYTPSQFEESRPEVLQQMLHDHPLGLLITHGASGLDANPVPFMWFAEPGSPGVLRGHVARANPLWRDARAEVLAVFQGPQVYVTPSWYATKAETGKVVPTWNYVTVQARGRLQAHDDPAWLRAFLAQLTARHEAPRDAPWAIDDAPADYIDKQLRAIVGIEISLSSLSGKWKVSQNRPAADREGVVRGLTAQGGDNALACAQWVRAATPT
jgi:transcriptional regulator